MIENILYILGAYIVGSIPFGYIVTKAFSGGNILSIGWKKTSGSNVVKNIGCAAGILTGVLDIVKGFIYVWSGVFLFQLSPIVCAIAGVVVVVGNNWSCFLKFSGGRGLGTYIGVLLALAPKIFFIGIIPLIAFAFIWDGSIGTILFMITSIAISAYIDNQAAMLMTSLIVLPMFLKRLSPISDLSGKWFGKLFFNRLIFDGDEARGPRIARILKVKNNNTK